MIYKKNINYIYYFFGIFLIILIVFTYFFFNKIQNEKKLVLEPISINLLTSVHPKLSWHFKPVKPKININMLIDEMIENELKHIFK